jgi:IS5 family transposase
VLRETDSQTTMWELLLPEEAKRLPAELVRIDAYLDDERFIAPWRRLFDRRQGAAVSSSRHAAAAAVPETPL